MRPKKITPEVFESMKKMDESGVSRAEIARQYNVSRPTVTIRLGPKRRYVKHNI